MVGRRALVVVLALVVAAGAAAGTGGPVSAAPGSVHLTASGDFNSTANTLAVLDEIDDLDPDAHLALGDLSYGATGAEQTWCDLVTSRVGAGFPFELVAGNHESNGQNGNINDFSACLPNQLPGVVGTYGRQWYVDVPAGAPVARVLMISPGITYPGGFQGYAAGSPQYAWTAAAIDGARAAQIPWVVVGAHMPCQSMGEYSCPMGTDLMNLLVSKKVDLVLSGHEHLYQRSKQLAQRTGCTTVPAGTYDPDCVVDGDNDLAQGAGTVMTTVGTSGVVLRNVNLADTEAGYFATWSGLNAQPSYGVLDLDVQPTTLTGRFVAASGSYSDQFTITAGPPPANQPPTASIATPVCSGLTCTFDGSGSTDGDGTVTGHAWTFGDGSTGTGATTSRTFAAAGTYQVGLTVTDDDGDTGTTSVPVTVAEAGAAFASDTFTRTVASGWGTADVGGAWTTTGTASVGSGRGRLVAAAGAGSSAALRPGDTTDTDLTLTTSIDRAATSNGSMLWVRARRVTGVGDYRSKVWWQTGGLRVSLVRANSAGTETLISPTVAIPGTVAVGDQFVVRTRVTGASPTTLQVKVWRAGQAEPAAWTATATDATAGFQVPGSITLSTYVSGGTTNGPVTVTVDDVVARH